MSPRDKREQGSILEGCGAVSPEKLEAESEDQVRPKPQKEAYLEQDHTRNLPHPQGARGKYNYFYHKFSTMKNITYFSTMEGLSIL